MKEPFEGYHGEWNLGSPGGWEYQRMVQEIYQPAWDRIKQLTGLELELDLEHPLFQPSLGFAQKVVLVKSRQRFPGKEPFIVLVAEEESLKEVTENKRFVDYLNSLDGVEARLAGPAALSVKNNKVFLKGQEITTIFMDFNTSVLVKLAKKHSIAPLLKAIENDILVNPRGMEPVGVKGVFEVVTDRFSSRLTATTVQRTPWTRRFYQRKTTGPDGEKIDDLIKWTEAHWQNLILKPDDGYSGKGIIVCPLEKDKKTKIKSALAAGNYIVQQFIPQGLWSEQMPFLDKANKKVILIQQQTDFRCLICQEGLIGFVARYGKIPTNVGAGGGVQALAVVKSKHSPGQAAQLINKALLELDFKTAKSIRQILDQKALAMKFTYLLGPIPICLRPRLLSLEQIEALNKYAQNLYQDTLLLEKIWLEGGLDEIVKISQKEKQIAKLQPRNEQSPALLASDGLFNFGAGVKV